MLGNRLTCLLKELSKRKLVALCLFAVIAVFTACQDITGPEAGIPGARFSAAKVNQTPITNQADLADIQNNPTGDYVLANDITLEEWEPICGPYTGTPSFSGTLDGAGYTITVESFDPAALQQIDDYLGIFQTSNVYVDGYDEYIPSISNLTVVNLAPEPTTAQYVGGLVAYAQGTLFTNITVNGMFTVNDTTEADNFNFGGVAGYAGLGQGLYAHATIFSGITVNANVSAAYSSSEAEVGNIGGVAGYAESSTFTGITLGTILVSARYTSQTAPDWALLVNKGVFPDQAVVITVQPETGLFTGGVVGYVNTSQINTVISAANVISRSRATAAYTGGVAGYAEGTNIYTSQSSGLVTSDGPGYNTSAGGIAGYIVASRVRDSSAGGRIRAIASSQSFGWSDSWQVYAGGLVGYAGGSDAGPSTVEHNYATGEVSATSPFPYAGGLVGYNYGFNDFTNPAKNGSRIATSYATGSVTAFSQEDTSNTWGDVPYAGGLVGYSSVVESLIADSYATGNVSATTNGTYAWAGGVIGGNANDAVVTRTYATGDVTSTVGTLPPLYAPDYADAGPAAGGIAGFNYYSAKTTVSYSVALNNQVEGLNNTLGVVHRVVGSIGNTSGHIGTLINNIANEEMIVLDNWQLDEGYDKLDGENTAPQPPQSVYAGLNWDFGNTWTMSGAYPTLK
jgi:hypothetical protein